MPPDPYADCFLKSTPPNNLTFSHRRRPCRFEPPLDGSSTSQPCPFKKNFCERIENATLQSGDRISEIITRAYSEKIKNLLTESSTSIVVRSEQQFHVRDMFRTTQRRHLYEALQNADSPDWSRFGILCTPIHRGDRYGEYLGFLELRSHFDCSPIAFALLVEPGSVREDPRAFVIRGDYGPLFGAHSFRSSVYVMQDPKTAGAMCAQSCIIMTLGMLGDRKSSIKGSFTVTFLGHLVQLARERRNRTKTNGGQERSIEFHIDELREELENEVPVAGSTEPFSEFAVNGLDPIEICDVLRQCNVASEVVVTSHHTTGASSYPPSIRRALRIIEANVRARFPVILSVSSTVWSLPISPEQLSERLSPDDENADFGHAVVVVGLRKNALNEVTSLIIHDPASQPFLERSPESCFEAARALRVKQESKWGQSNRYFITIATEKSIRLHAHDCIEFLSKNNREFKLFADFAMCKPGTNYQISLSNSRSVLQILCPEKAHKKSAKLLSERVWSDVDRVWAVVTYKDLQPQNAWLFDANSLERKHFLKMSWEKNGEVLMETRADGERCICKL